MRTLLTVAAGLFLLIPCRADEGVETTELIIIAKQIRAELRLLDAIMDIYAIENDQPRVVSISAQQLHQALASIRAGKPLIRLSIALQAKDGPEDLLGNPYGSFIVGHHPHLHSDTFAALAAVAPAEFWGEYAPQK